MELAYVAAVKDAHFRRPTMKDWLIVKDSYIVLEDDPTTRVFLSVEDIGADDWESDVTTEQIMAEDVEETVDLVLRALRDVKSKVGEAAIERLLGHRDRIIAVNKEKARHSSATKVKKRLVPAGRGNPPNDEPDYE